jgi:hypothetical protein
MKIALFPLLLAAACIIAGLYGALHDQISYTVSPDYYYAFKFDQFAIPENLHNRVGAALVGWHASWWMGLFIGLPVLIIGLIMPDGRSYMLHALIAFAIVAVTTLLVGLGALAVASAIITPANLPDFGYPDAVADKVAFARAGTMHNFSYLGGFLGILTASLYLIVARVRLARRRSKPAR